ncbi:MAG TPA: hypothetical protein VNA44_00240 [Burkholderiaceae bacterium]|nr:hypothetical protein [Burkholderiaceae bacterium]
MTKQNQQQPQQEQQQQNTSQRGNNPDQQGGKNAQGQSQAKGSQGQPGERQSVQGGAWEASGSRTQGAPAGSQRGQTTSQQCQLADDDSPEINKGDEQSSSDKLRQGALDTQYGTDSASKTEQTNRPQGSQSTGSDRDTLSGSRNKDR